MSRRVTGWTTSTDTQPRASSFFAVGPRGVPKVTRKLRRVACGGAVAVLIRRTRREELRASRTRFRRTEQLERMSTRGINAAFRDDEIHRHIVRLREDRFKTKRFVAHTDRNRAWFSRGQCAIEESAAVAETIAASVETIHRNDRHVGRHYLCAVRNGNIVDAGAHQYAGRPQSELERHALPHHFG